MPSAKKVRLSLEKLPTGIRSIYDAAFDRICSQNEECVKLSFRVLCWLSHANMPLEIRQLQHGLAVMDLDKDESEIEDEALPDVELMLSVCAGLVRVDHESNRTQLVHYTTQEYLDQSDIRNTYFRTGHMDIANACLKYLLLDAFADGPAVSDASDGTDRVMDARLEHHALLAYAACSWGYHVRKCKGNVDHDLLKAFLNDSERLTAAEQAQIYSTQSSSAPEGFSGYCMTRGLTALHLAARNGFGGVVSRILQEHRMEDITAVLDSDGRTPLHRAAEQADPSLIDALIDAGGRLEARDRRSMTVLHVAIVSGHEGVVQRLLDRGSDKQAMSDLGWSPITLAIKFGSEACVPVLLDRGCDVNLIGHADDDPFRHRFENLPLLAACSDIWSSNDGKWDLFLMLLDHGANANIKLRHGYKILHRLARRSLLSIVPFMEVLLDRGAAVNARSDNGETALHQAARYDQEGHITNLLLEKGACTEIHCTKSVTLVQQAATTTNDCVNEFIYEEGDSSWPKDPREWTYSHQEAIRQAKTVLDLLKARKASILQDPGYSTDFRTSESITYFNILLGLLEDSDSATVKAQVEEALTQWAQTRYNSYAHGIVDRMLQEGGVSLRGGREETWFTLKMLNEEAYVSIVDGSIEFEPGIDPFAEIDEAWTPLHMAVFYGNWKTVMILIEAGANVDAMTQMGRTPLSIAVRKGEEVIAWLLLSKGASHGLKDAASGIIFETFRDQRDDWDS